VRIGKLHQNTTRRTALRVVNILTYREKYSWASYIGLKHTNSFVLMRDTDVSHFIENVFKTLEINARILTDMRAAQQGPKQKSI